MKIVKKDLRNGIIKLIPQSLDDLWYIERVLESGDRVSARTARSLILHRGETREKTEKKPMKLGIEVKKIEFHKYSSQLRISGTILSAPEEVQVGSYHTISIEENSPLTIKKEWKKYQLDLLEKSKKLTPEILIVAIDYGHCKIVRLKASGLETVSEIREQIGKLSQEKKPQFYKEILEVIEGHSKDAKKIIICGPGFAKEELSETIKEPETSKKIVLEPCGSVESGINEILKKGVIEKVIGESRIAEEAKHVNEFLEQLGKDGKCAYGLDAVKKAVEYGTVETLLVSVEKIREKEIEDLMLSTEKQKGKVLIISSEHDAGKQLSGLGGIAALLRFKV